MNVHNNIALSLSLYLVNKYEQHDRESLRIQKGGVLQYCSVCSMLFIQ